MYPLYKRISNRMDFDEGAEWGVDLNRLDGKRLILMSLIKQMSRAISEGSTFIEFTVPKIFLTFLEENSMDSQFASNILNSLDLFHDEQPKLLWIQSQNGDWKLEFITNLLCSDSRLSQTMNALAYICKMFAGSEKDRSLSCAVLLHFQNKLSGEKRPLFGVDAPCFMKFRLIEQPRTAWRILQQLFGDSCGIHYNAEQWSAIRSRFVVEYEIFEDDEAKDILDILKVVVGFASVPGIKWTEWKEMDSGANSATDFVAVPEEINIIAILLQILDQSAFKKLISSQSLHIKGETSNIYIALSEEQMVRRIDSIVCDLYHLLVQFAFVKLNMKLVDIQNSDQSTILANKPFPGILATNGYHFRDSIGNFEDLLSNYLNERLHQVFSKDYDIWLFQPCEDRDYLSIEGNNGVFEVLENRSLGPLVRNADGDTVVKKLQLSKTSFARSAGSSLFCVSHFHQIVTYCGDDFIELNCSSTNLPATRALLQLSGLPLSSFLLELMNFQFAGEESTVKSDENLALNNINKPQTTTRASRLTHNQFSREVRGLLHNLHYFRSCYTIVDASEIVNTDNISGDMENFMRRSGLFFSYLVSNHPVMQISTSIAEFVKRFTRITSIVNEMGSLPLNEGNLHLVDDSPAFIRIACCHSGICFHTKRSLCNTVIFLCGNHKLHISEASMNHLENRLHTVSHRAASRISALWRSYFRWKRQCTVHCRRITIATTDEQDIDYRRNAIATTDEQDVGCRRVAIVSTDEQDDDCRRNAIATTDEQDDDCRRNAITTTDEQDDDCRRNAITTTDNQDDDCRRIAITTTDKQDVDCRRIAIASTDKQDNWNGVVSIASLLGSLSYKVGMIITVMLVIVVQEVMECTAVMTRDEITDSLSFMIAILLFSQF